MTHEKYGNEVTLNPPPDLQLKDFDEIFNDGKNLGYLPEKVKRDPDPERGPPGAMHRKLKERQLTMILLLFYVASAFTAEAAFYTVWLSMGWPPKSLEK
ncbi:hypothetical protein PtB15_5B42 [Puccinia triticina]|nr:hypothetical protein PtB15_5B42 [Puccinia triticina]